MLIHSGWIAAAFLAGVLLTSWLKERRPSLKARVRKAAVFRGKTCHEVICEMKTPQRTIQMPDGRIRRIWMENGYRISLLFDAKNLCLGVEEEQEGKEQEGREPVVSQYATALPLPEEAGANCALFAKGYNDLILRSFDELPVWKNYLRDNPRRLLLKRARPEWLRPFFGLQIGSHTYNGIGNRLLLTASKRKTVLVSRRLTDSMIEEETARYLELAKQGTVLISAAISPGEKRVMRAVFDAGYPTIVIMQNGFTPMSKPHGRQFDACASGALLMLSPWEHHNEKQKITAVQCRQMNLMVLEICEN